MKSKIIVSLIIFLMLFFITGCETLQKIMPIEEAPVKELEAKEEMPELEEEMQQPEEPTVTSEPEIPEGTLTQPEEPVETPKETPEEQTSKPTTILTVTPKTVKPTELVTVKVMPNTEYGYKTTIKIYDESEERVKQVYISGCGSICKKEKSTSFKAEYDWKGSYCARVVDVETNEEVGDCFKVA